MNEATFIKLYSFLCSYNLTDKERKILLWKFGCKCSLDRIAELLEVTNCVEDSEQIKDADLEPLVSREYVRQELENIIDKVKHYQLGEEMSCLNCIWFKYVGRSTKYVYCSAGNILNHKGDDVKIRWKNKQGLDLTNDIRKDMKKLRGCKLFQTVKGD